MLILGQIGETGFVSVAIRVPVGPIRRGQHVGWGSVAGRGDILLGQPTPGDIPLGERVSLVLLAIYWMSSRSFRRLTGRV